MTDPSFDVERAAQRLGQRRADELDVERVAAQVVGRLRQRQPWWQAPSLLKAAAVVALLGGGVTIGRFIPDYSDAGPSAVQAAPVAFEGLTAADLTAVLDSMAFEAPPSTYVARGLHDLSESQLRELLSLEG